MLVVGIAASTAHGIVVPPLTGPVVDQAELLSPRVRAAVERSLRDLWNAGGSQIAVLTVRNLGGLPIEEVAIKVVEEWKLGSAEGDNGILLLVAKEDRALRIEVGQGLEGSLPDAFARRIVDDVITPRFKAGDFDRGIVSGVNAILRRTDPKAAPINDFGDRPSESANFGGVDLDPRYLVFLGVAVFMILARGHVRYGSRRSRGVYSWGHGGGYYDDDGFSGGSGFFGGGGFSSGGDSSSGGGFSGGGGGFSGGGASGRW